MNDNNNKVNTYKATQNLNTAIENPQINVNSATGINIEDSGHNNYADNSTNNNNNFLNNNYNQQNDNINNNNNFLNNSPSYLSNEQSENKSNSTTNNYNTKLTNENVNYNYEPVMKEKKRADDNALSNTIHSKEFKIMIFLIFVLVLFILLMPYIYDFFSNLGRKIPA